MSLRWDSMGQAPSSEWQESYTRPRNEAEPPEARGQVVRPPLGKLDYCRRFRAGRLVPVPLAVRPCSDEVDAAPKHDCYHSELGA
jgi:hypothetical protein